MTVDEINQGVAKWIEPEPPKMREDADVLLAEGRTIESPGGGWEAAWRGFEPDWVPAPFATDIRAAWKVIEKLRNSGKWCCVEVASDYHYTYIVNLRKTEDPEHKPDIHVDADTAPMAICLAALKVAELEAER